jgi:RHS repeat-associated protein
MNPAVVIAGGGGAGGGSGPGGGGADGGDQGAGTGKGSDDPNGGGKSGEDCGAGGNGGCTGCGAQIAKGDPVDVATGEVFTVPATDLHLPGYFNLEIIRSYSTRDRNRNTGFGWGWAHCLDWEMRREGDRLRIWSGSGTNEVLPVPEPGGITDAGPWIVLPIPDGYMVRTGNEFLHYFIQDPKDPDLYRLVAVAYRRRGTIRLFYNQGRLVLILDSVGREIHLVRDSKGQVTSLEVPAENAPTRTFARFRYDHEGDLVEAIDANGHSTSYQYDAAHRLVQYRYSTGLTFHFKYDQKGRCFETWGDYPGGQDPALAASLPVLLADNQTHAKGIYHCVMTFAEDGYTEVVDSVRLQRFFTNPKGLVEKGVDAMGSATERTFDDLGRVASITDRLGGTATFEYDTGGNVIKETDAEGHVYQFEFNLQSRLTKAVDPAGGTFTFNYNTQEELEYIQDPRGGTEYHHVDEHGLVVARHYPNGGRAEYRYDSHANCVWRKDPNGHEYRYLYDWWGNCIEKHAPNGRVTKVGYSNTGQVVYAQDSQGVEKRFEYDAMGNCTAIQGRDKLWTRLFYGGYGWLFCITDPDGTTRERRYNREGWLVELKNERGERHVVEHDPNGLPANETTYDGRHNRAGYDAMYRLLWLEKDDDRTEFERSPLGLVLTKVKLSGAEQRFRYNMRGELVAAQNGPIAFEWTRDPLGELTSEKLQIGDTEYDLAFEVDPDGKRTKLTTSTGLSFDYRRDADGNVSAIQSKGRQLIDMKRSFEGTSVHWQLPGGAAITDDVDLWGRVERRRLLTGEHPAKSQEPEWVGETNRGLFRVYQWDASHQRQQEYSANGATTYEYDTRQFLRKKHSSTTGTEEFRYDETGNPYDAGEVTAPRRTYGPGDLLEARGQVSYRYDEHHCLVEKRAVKSDGTTDVWHFEWDDWRMLSAVETPKNIRAEYQYDAFARRMQKKVYRIETEPALAGEHTLLWRTDYLWENASLLQELTYDAEGKLLRTRSYLHDPEHSYIPIAHQDDGGEWHYYFTDANGTPEEILDGRGQVLGRLQRKAYGRTEVVQGSKESTQIRFPGQYEDPETGLHYNRYRYYDPDTGRYLSPDPIGVEGGENLFAYGPNPVGYIDTMGWTHHVTIDEAKGTSKNDLVGSDGNSLKGKTLDSLMGDGVDPLLNNRASCHTERKGLHEVLANNSDDELENAQIKMTGKYPPCPNCHRAMHNFAKGGNNRKVTYSWVDHEGVKQTVTYGKDGPKASSTPEKGKKLKPDQDRAQQLLDHYKMQETGDDSKYSKEQLNAQKDAKDKWKYDKWRDGEKKDGTGDGAWDEYGRQRDKIDGK